MYVLVVLIGANAKTTVKVKEVNGQAKKITSPSKPKVKTVKKVYSLPGQNPRLVFNCFTAFFL